jgi:hypothetical protein
MNCFSSSILTRDHPLLGLLSPRWPPLRRQRGPTPFLPAAVRPGSSVLVAQRPCPLPPPGGGVAILSNDIAAPPPSSRRWCGPVPPSRWRRGPAPFLLLVAVWPRPLPPPDGGAVSTSAHAHPCATSVIAPSCERTRPRAQAAPSRDPDAAKSSILKAVSKQAPSASLGSGHLQKQMEIFQKVAFGKAAAPQTRP